jgi:hypothetical protein
VAGASDELRLHPHVRAKRCAAEHERDEAHPDASLNCHDAARAGRGLSQTAVEARLGRLRELGVSIAVDDFRIGYSVAQAILRLARTTLPRTTARASKQRINSTRCASLARATQVSRVLAGSGRPPGSSLPLVSQLKHSSTRRGALEQTDALR